MQDNRCSGRGIKHLTTAPRETVTFVNTSQPKNGKTKTGKKKKLGKNRLLEADWHTNLARFQGARFGHVRVESSSCCFPRELMSFVHPRELVSFDPWDVKRSPPIGKRNLVGRYNKAFYR